MKTIYKYVIPFVDSGRFELEYDHNGCIVKIDMQNDEPVMWIQVETNNSTKKHQFQIRGTGHEIEPGELYMDTFYMGSFVWHVFKVYE